MRKAWIIGLCILMINMAIAETPSTNNNANIPLDSVPAVANNVANIDFNPTSPASCICAGTSDCTVQCANDSFANCGSINMHKNNIIFNGAGTLLINVSITNFTIARAQNGCKTLGSLG